MQVANRGLSGYLFNDLDDETEDAFEAFMSGVQFERDGKFRVDGEYLYARYFPDKTACLGRCAIKDNKDEKIEDLKTPVDIVDFDARDGHLIIAGTNAQQYYYDFRAKRWISIDDCTKSGKIDTKVTTCGGDYYEINALEGWGRPFHFVKKGEWEKVCDYRACGILAGPKCLYMQFSGGKLSTWSAESKSYTDLSDESTTTDITIGGVALNILYRTSKEGTVEKNEERKKWSTVCSHKQLVQIWADKKWLYVITSSTLFRYSH